MRILGFQRKDWLNYLTGKPKLEEDIFTSFRFSRRDKDWAIGEIVQVVVKPRSKEREVLGKAVILNKEKRYMPRPLEKLGYPHITDDEVKRDGFTDLYLMWKWLFYIYGWQRLVDEPMNKLTLQWIERRLGK